MIEDGGRAWFERAFDVPRGTMTRLDAFAAFLREESSRQNLVSRASLDQLWLRHIGDSAQLVRFAPPGASWVDLGSGAGFPGLIAAVLHDGPVTLVEERRLRVEYLRRAADLLGVSVEILPVRVERLLGRTFGVISARALAPLARLLDLATHLSTTNSVWILPKGRNAQSELAAARASWQGDFRLEPSLTDPDARIIVAKGVHRRVKRMRR